MKIKKCKHCEGKRVTEVFIKDVYVTQCLDCFKTTSKTLKEALEENENEI